MLRRVFIPYTNSVRQRVFVLSFCNKFSSFQETNDSFEDLLGYV